MSDPAAPSLLGQLLGVLLTLLSLLWQFVLELLVWLGQFLVALLPFAPVLAWCAWWLFCVDWRRAWPILARGGWAVAVLLTVLAALVWTALFPHRPDFFWQLAASALLAALALFCGWLQGVLGWTPAEVTFDPPAEAHDGHGHGGHH